LARNTFFINYLIIYLEVRILYYFLTFVKIDNTKCVPL